MYGRGHDTHIESDTGKSSTVIGPDPSNWREEADAEKDVIGRPVEETKLDDQHQEEYIETREAPIKERDDLPAPTSQERWLQVKLARVLRTSRRIWQLMSWKDSQDDLTKGKPLEAFFLKKTWDALPGPWLQMHYRQSELPKRLKTLVPQGERRQNSVWDTCFEWSPLWQTHVDRGITFAKQSGPETRTLAAISISTGLSAGNQHIADPYVLMLLFFWVRERIAPVTFVNGAGQQFTVPFERIRHFSVSCAPSQLLPLTSGSQQPSVTGFLSLEIMALRRYLST